MLIRSQDKKSVKNLDNVKGFRISNHVIYESEFSSLEISREIYIEFDGEIMGQYSTEAKAIKVMDMISNTYVGTCYTDTEFNGVAQCSVVIKNNVVFEMPSDEEMK